MSRSRSSSSVLIQLVLCLALKVAASAQCPAGQPACGQGMCVAAGTSCRNERCINSQGKPILCNPASQVCGGEVCPVWGFCGAGHSRSLPRCHPETCAHRLAFWCPQAGAQLIKVACPSHAAAADCYASSSGVAFSCRLAGRWLIANCSGELAVRMAAAPLQPEALGNTPPSVGHSWLQASLSRFGSMFSRTSSASSGGGSRRSLLQLFLPGLDSSSINYVFPGGDSYDSNVDDYSGGLSGQQQHQYASSGWSGGPSSSGSAPGAATFTPVINPPGNIVQSGSSSSPGGAFISAGPGGLVAGSYGGGWRGPYNAATSTYGTGGSYGFAQAYQGLAAGSAVVFMPATFAPNAPNITYPCPPGRAVGSMLTVGIPCGVPITSVPAAWLPTIGGLPAGVDLTKLPGVGSMTAPGGAPATAPGTAPVTPTPTPTPAPIPNPTPTPIPITPPAASPTITPPIVRPSPAPTPTPSPTPVPSPTPQPAASTRPNGRRSSSERTGDTTTSGVGSGGSTDSPSSGGSIDSASSVGLDSLMSALLASMMQGA